MSKAQNKICSLHKIYANCIYLCSLHILDMLGAYFRYAPSINICTLHKFVTFDIKFMLGAYLKYAPSISKICNEHKLCFDPYGTPYSREAISVLSVIFVTSCCCVTK